VARDASWRPRETPPGLNKQRLRLGFLAVLVAVNIGVIIYHGDPRDRLPARPTPRVKSAVEPRPRSQAAPLSQSGLAAVTDRQTAPSLVAEIQPTQGLRTPSRVQQVLDITLKRGQTVAAALSSAGIRNEEINAALGSLTGVVDFRRLRPGHQLKARLDKDQRLIGLDVHAGPVDRARAHVGQHGWQGHTLDVHVDTLVHNVRGEVRSSLWDALVGTGEKPWLVTEVVDMFAWDIDFYTEVHPGDSFRLVVEKRYLDGDFVGYGALLAGEFVTQGQAHRAFRFQPSDGSAGFYDDAGRSLKKQLLKSPLQYGNVTSNFGMRFHPVLGYNRAHNGIDYGVPTGTPVWSVGDGTVVRAMQDRGFGKYIEVRHPNGWLSQYAHLSKIDVRVGQRVGQKDFIGKTGSTGLSTGPHLHFGLKRNNTYVNPAAQKFERSKALTGKDLETFLEQVKKLTGALDELKVAHEAVAAGAREG